MSAEDRYELNRDSEGGYKLWLVIEANSPLNVSTVMTFGVIKKKRKIVNHT